MLLRLGVILHCLGGQVCTAVQSARVQAEVQLTGAVDCTARDTVDTVATLCPRSGQRRPPALQLGNGAKA